MVLAHYGAELRWSDVVARATEWGVRKHVYLTMRLVSEMLPMDGARVPFDKLKPHDMDEHVSDLARRQMLMPVVLTRRPRRDLCASFIAMCRMQGAWRRLRYFMRWCAFPPYYHLTEQYRGVRRGPRLLWFYTRSVVDAVSYLCYDIWLNRRERRRIGFESWCSSSDAGTGRVRL